MHAYQEWGADCVNHFNGMFAFALVDRRRRSVFLARDHLGIKPLYYAIVGSQVLFASEIRALLQHPGLVREVDLDALGELFTFRYVPSPKTLFKGIYRLPPAHRMDVTSDGVRIERFWTWVPQHRTRWDVQELVEEYQALLEDAVRLQLRSDVPLGLFLSSGVDSGALLAIMSQHSSGPVQAFTIGFEGGDKTNEVTDAAHMARRFGAEHHTMMLSGKALPRLLRALHERPRRAGSPRAGARVLLPVAADADPGEGRADRARRRRALGRLRRATWGCGCPPSTAACRGRSPSSFAPWMARLPFPMERFKRGVASLVRARRADPPHQGVLVLQRRHEGADVQGSAARALHGVALRNAGKRCGTCSRTWRTSTR